MTAGSKILYEFGPFRVDPEKQLLLCDNQPVAITPKTFETLLILVRHSREVVSKDELMKELWPDAFVEESNLSQNIFMLRKALGDTPEDRRYIVTLPGKGYRFAAEVRSVTQNGEDVIIASRSQMVLEQPKSPPAENLPALLSGDERKPRWKYLVAIIVTAGLLAVGIAWFLRKHQRVAWGEKDSILVADFTNKTGDPVFDDALRQGLAVQLDQSPSLRLVSDDRIQQVLRMMGQPLDARLTPTVAREVCERTASAAVLEGSIAEIGKQYLLTLTAVNCTNGELLASAEAQASDKNHVLDALGKTASEIRNQLGESLSTIQKFDTPLEQATTPSLEALKAYSMGWKALHARGETAAIPLFHQAVEDDPQFALAYAALGLMYGVTGQSALSAESTSKAYHLRERTSDREKFFITATYEGWVTGNLEKAQQACETWAQVYPADIVPHTYLSGFIYPAFSKFEQTVLEAQKAIGLDQDFAVGYLNLAYGHVYLDHVAKAEDALRRASEHKLETPYFSILRYDLAFLKADKTAMEHEVAFAKEVPAFEDWIIAREAFSSAYSGHLQQAGILARRAVDLAQQGGQRERAALFQTGTALREALFGNPATARTSALAALKLSNDREVEYGAAFALALSGDSVSAQALASDLEGRFPEDTSVRFSYLPAVRAQLALNHRELSRAVALLQVAVPYELGIPRSTIHGNFGALYPVYVRGQAYLAAHQGAEAAAEFQKILDHRGIVSNDPVGALTHLGLARAYDLQGDTQKAKAAYQDFLTLWKDADPDIPIYKQAKAEYAKLQSHD